MEQFGPSDYRRHEYPDPDYAAHVTRYPWREDDGYLPSALHGLPPESLENISRPANYGIPWQGRDDRDETLDIDAQGSGREVRWDSDYQVSEAGVT